MILDWPRLERSSDIIAVEETDGQRAGKFDLKKFTSDVDGSKDGAEKTKAKRVRLVLVPWLYLKPRREEEAYLCM